MASLFINKQLNYFEALDRMAHWIDEIEKHGDPGGHNLGRIHVLHMALVKHADALYIDPYYVRPT